MAEDPEEAEDDPSVLTPEELRIEDEREDEIKKIGENRYLVSANVDNEGDGETPRTLPVGDDAEPTEARGDATASADRPAPTSENSATADEGRPTAPGSPPTADESDAAESSADNSVAGPDVELEPRAVALQHSSGRHGIDVVVRTDDGIAERRITADDRVDVFEEFLRWYARRIDPDASPAATISALLAEADLSD